MKRTTMELGGHSPVVVFDDADPEKAADTIAAFKYRNAGQVCISPTRFYVQEPVYKRFLARFTEYANGVKLGDGLEKGITMGPMANSAITRELRGRRQNRNGKVTGGAPRQPGLFLRADGGADVPDDQGDGRIVRADRADRHLQDLRRGGGAGELAREYGLAAHAFTSSNATAAAIGDAIESAWSGQFRRGRRRGAVRRRQESGHGSEGGIEGSAPTSIPSSSRRGDTEMQVGSSAPRETQPPSARGVLSGLAALDPTYG